jgi:hypothetical protein
LKEKKLLSVYYSDTYSFSNSEYFIKNPININGIIKEVIECETTLSYPIEKATPDILDTANAAVILL